MKIAIIHDWLLGMRGGEKCLEAILELYPDSDVYTAFYDAKNVSKKITSKNVYTSILNKIPFFKKVHRFLLPLYPIASWSISRQLNKKDYDLVISISHCLAKNVKVNAFHISYCLSPARYIWDKYDSYFENKPYEPLARIACKYLRVWDVKGARNVDCFVGISNFIQQRIKKVYNLDSEVIYPPVKTNWPEVKDIKTESAELEDKVLEKKPFLCVSALVPYKNVDTIVEAFNDLGFELSVVGAGPEISNIKKIAKNNVKILGKVSDDNLARLYSTSRALVFCAEEDFGIVPLEAQSLGLPVIALGKGGALETVIKHKTGVFFENNTKKSIKNAVMEFTQIEKQIKIEDCINQAEKFSYSCFKAEFSKLINENINKLEQDKVEKSELKNAKKTLANI